MLQVLFQDLHFPIDPKTHSLKEELSILWSHQHIPWFWKKDCWLRLLLPESRLQQKVESDLLEHRKTAPKR